MNSEILQVLRVSCLAAPSSSSDGSVTRVRRLCWSRPPALVAPRPWAGVCRRRGSAGGGGSPALRGRGDPRLAAGGCPGGWPRGPVGGGAAQTEAGLSSASLPSYPQGLRPGVRQAGRTARLSLGFRPRGRVSVNPSLLLFRNSGAQDSVQSPHKTAAVNCALREINFRSYF